MSNEIQCYDKAGKPKCHYYSITRYGKLCSFDGTWNPRKADCPHFIPLTEDFSPYTYIEDEIPHVADLGWAGSIKKSCHNCIWRNYKRGSQMTCDNIMARHEIQTNPKFITPCEWFELDETGDEYLVRQTEGYSWVKEERKLRK